MIELLVVATIMIVLTTIGLISYQRSSQNGRNAKRKADLETVRQALVLYRNDEGSYPTGNGTGAAFTTMLATLTDYLSFANISDPKNADPYVYTYQSDGVTFSACSYLEQEPAPEQYCAISP